MLKLQYIILETKSPDIVVGLIDLDHNVICSNNIDSHEQLYDKYSEWIRRTVKPWRYNAITHTVYWYYSPTEDEKNVVKNEINKKFKYFHVLYNINVFGNKDVNLTQKLVNLAHGI